MSKNIEVIRKEALPGVDVDKIFEFTISLNKEVEKGGNLANKNISYLRIIITKLDLDRCALHRLH